MTHLFNQNWTNAKKLIHDEPQVASDLFYDWFCSNQSLLGRAKNLLPKINFVFDCLKLNQDNFRVTLKNNCPVYGELYDSFIIDSLDDKLRLYISPKLGYDNKDLNGKCEISVISYKKVITGKHILNLTFDNWMTFKKQLKSKELIDKILGALNE